MDAELFQSMMMTADSTGMAAVLRGACSAQPTASLKAKTTKKTRKKKKPAARVVSADESGGDSEDDGSDSDFETLRSQLTPSQLTPFQRQEFDSALAEVWKTMHLEGSPLQ